MNRKVSQEIEDFAAQYRHNYRDALNVALARLKAAEAKTDVALARLEAAEARIEQLEQERDHWYNEYMDTTVQAGVQ